MTEKIIHQKTHFNNDKRIDEVEDDDPYVYVNGKKEMKDGSGMVKESMEVKDV